MLNFLLLSLILTISIGYIFLHLNAKNKQLQQSINQLQYNLAKQQETTIEQTTQQPSLNSMITNRDYRIIYDPLAPAVQRPATSVFPPTDIARYIDIPTRGYPDNYQYIGNLVRNNDEKVIKLFARQRLERRDQYEYYGISADMQGLDYKIPIETKYYQELYDGDEIDVSYYDTAKGKFKVMIFPDQTFRYNPNIL